MNDLIPKSWQQSLAFLENAKRLLAQARTVEKVKEIRDQAQTIQFYLQRRDGGEEAAMDAGEIKVRAERKLGEMLAAEGERRGGSDSKFRRGTLKSLPESVDKKQSHIWKKVASVPESAFEESLSASRDAGEAPTTAGICRLAPKPPVPEPNFDFFGEGAAIFDWLVKRRESWPVIFQPHFVEVMRSVLEHLESNNDVERRFGEGETQTG
jgi:hypothetical protein